MAEALQGGWGRRVCATAYCGDYAGFTEGDALFFTNFRDDRMLQLAMYCAGDILAKSKDLSSFMSSDYYLPHPIGSMMPPHEKREAFDNFYVAFPKQPLRDTLGEYVAQAGRKQLRLAESEKYPHVTYFFSGGGEKKFKGEKCILVSSPKDVATYDRKPEMSAGEVAFFFCHNPSQEDFSLFVLNYANPDMVGHTGNLEAAKEAIEAVDTCFGNS